MKSYEYGQSDIAGACGKSEGAVRVDITRGKVIPGNLRSVSLYVVREILKGTDDGTANPTA